MKTKEYLVVDSNNNWLFMGLDKKEAQKELKSFVKIGKSKNPYYEGMEIGDIVYLYEAVEITSEKTY